MRFLSCSLFFSLFLYLIPYTSFSQVFWTETFGNDAGSCASQGTLANGFNNGNGAWTVTNTGANGGGANQFFVSSTEAGMGVNQCGDGCQANPALTNRTLHLGSVVNGFCGCFVCPTGDCGAAYDACNVNLCGGSPINTDRRAESPTINCTGQSTITLAFNYIENGQAALDDATLWYFDGAVWAPLDPLAKTPGTCAPQGTWTGFTIPLPASANNNPLVKIGFRWVNNQDGNGSDPSFAVDDITLSSVSGAPPVAAFTMSANNICVGSCVNFTDNSTGTPTSWSWTFPGGTPPTSNIQNPSNVCYNTAGTYTVTLTATNANGSSTTTQVITVNPLPTVTINPAAPSFCGTASGTLTASGATSYLWAPATGLSCTTCANPTVTATSTTTYTVTGTGPGNCTSTATVLVTVHALPTVTISPNNPTYCTGGNAVLTASGAGTYTWTPATGLSCTTCSNPTTSTTTTTTYTVIGTDANGCTATASVTVTVVPALVATASANPATICMNDSTQLNGGGGSSYSWAPATGISCTTCQNPNAAPNVTTTYTVTVSGGTCPPATATVTVTVNPLPTVTINPSSATYCVGGNATFTASGGGTYSWSPATNLSCTTCANPTTTTTTSTTYTVTVTDANGCTNTAAIVVTVTPCAPPVAVITASATSVCMPGCIDFSDNSQNSPTSWSWTFTGGTPASSTQQNPGTVCWSVPGTYTVTLIVSNASGTDTTSQTIVVNPSPVAVTGPSVTIQIGQSVTLSASGGGTYSWSPATGLDCSTCQNPVASPTVTTTYCVTVTDVNGCTDDSCMTVIVDQNCGELFLPTAFSPDGNGVNDFFYPINPCIETMFLAVYDRWGEKVFESTDPNKKWDGRFRGKDLDAAVFVYYFHAVLINGEDIKMKGNVTLAR